MLGPRGQGAGDQADMFNGCARARSDITIAENLNFLSLARVIPIRAKEGQGDERKGKTGFRCRSMLYILKTFGSISKESLKMAA